LHLQAAMRSATVFAAMVAVALGESSSSISSNPFLISARTEMRTPLHARDALDVSSVSCECAPFDRNLFGGSVRSNPCDRHVAPTYFDVVIFWGGSYVSSSLLDEFPKLKYVS